MVLLADVKRAYVAEAVLGFRYTFIVVCDPNHHFALLRGSAEPNQDAVAPWRQWPIVRQPVIAPAGTAIALNADDCSVTLIDNVKMYLPAAR